MDSIQVILSELKSLRIRVEQLEDAVNANKPIVSLDKEGVN